MLENELKEMITLIIGNEITSEYQLRVQARFSDRNIFRQGDDVRTPG